MTSFQGVVVRRDTAEKALEALRRWHGQTVMTDAAWDDWKWRIDEFAATLQAANPSLEQRANAPATPPLGETRNTTGDPQ